MDDDFVSARPIVISEAHRRYQIEMIARLFGVPAWLVYGPEYKARAAERRVRMRKRMRRNRRGRNPRA